MHSVHALLTFLRANIAKHSELTFTTCLKTQTVKYLGCVTARLLASIYLFIYCFFLGKIKRLTVLKPDFLYHQCIPIFLLHAYVFIYSLSVVQIRLVCIAQFKEIQEFLNSTDSLYFMC